MSTMDTGGPRYHTLSVRLPLDEHERLGVAAAAADRSRGAQIRHLVKQFLAQEEARGVERTDQETPA